jgi:hypothetical protein
MSLKTRVARLEAKVPSLLEQLESMSDEELHEDIERLREELRDHIAGMTEEEFMAFITEEPSDTWGWDTDEELDQQVIEDQLQWYRRVRHEVTASEADPDECQ